MRPLKTKKKQIATATFVSLFVTKSLNDLLSLSIYLQADNNKEIELNSGEKKKVFSTSKLMYF